MEEVCKKKKPSPFNQCATVSGIHPSLLTIGADGGHPALAPYPAPINFKSKNESYTLSRAICTRHSERPDFSRTLLNFDYWPVFSFVATRCRTNAVFNPDETCAGDQATLCEFLRNNMKDKKTKPDPKSRKDVGSEVGVT